MITPLLYTPCRALSIRFGKFGAIFNYFCAIFYERGTAKDGQLCVILIFYGGRSKTCTRTVQKIGLRNACIKEKRSRINGSVDHLPYFFLHKLQKLL